MNPPIESESPLIKALLALITERWPEFLPHATLRPDGILEVVYPSPFRADGIPLFIQADPDFDEVIIGFDKGHSHGGPWDDPRCADFEFKSTINFIERIFAEDVVTCVFPGFTSMWTLASMMEKPEWPEVQRIRSWRGTHDRG